MAFQTIAEELNELVTNWVKKFENLPPPTISDRRNSQDRSIRQIVGHMVDSASNNTHRMVHLQYRESPVEFPNYATFGNNDRWIAIQNYQEENWSVLVNHWKFAHLHFIHVIRNINTEKLDQQWIADTNQFVSLKDMVEDFPRHFKLHIGEIEELLNQQ
ncbi:DinB family protein [Draconibacterium mangrovi]|uniref:DinB family protein n=1 Tax=Draconibacterium mangrovi TaxID=2697469 RepID=UPI0013D6A0AF|nr:DinB family protein [Draconibacterium mangrovi]